MARALALVTLAVLALPAGASSGETAGDSRALLRIVARDPLTLRGERFRAAERVQLYVLLGDRKASRKKLADSKGVFLATFAGFRLDRCTDLTVKAIGVKGSRAGFTLAHPLCPDVDRL